MNITLIYFSIFYCISLFSMDGADELGVRLRSLSFDELMHSADQGSLKENNYNLKSPNSADFKTPEQKKRKKSDKVSVFSPSQINDRYISNLNTTLSPVTPGTPPRSSSTIFTFSTPEVDRLQSVGSQINKMIDGTPGDRKRSIVRSVADKHKKSKLDGITDEIEQNNRLLQEYEALSNLTSVIVKNSKYLDSPQKHQLSALDTEHIKIPHVIYDTNNEIDQINGGHIIQPYFSQNILHVGDKAFIAHDKVIGVKVQNQHKKTFHPKFDIDQAVKNVRSAKTIAETQGYFAISKSPAGYYIGTYKNTENPLLHASQFPLITVTDEDQLQDIFVGNFAQLDASGNALQGSEEEPLFLPKVDFDTIMNHTQHNIPSNIKGVKVCKITQELENYFGIKFPAAVYGIKYH